MACLAALNICCRKEGPCRSPARAAPASYLKTAPGKPPEQSLLGARLPPDISSAAKKHPAGKQMEGNREAREDSG